MRLHRCIFWSILQILTPLVLSLKIELNEPQRNSAYIQGDYMIGALFSVHENPLLVKNDHYNPLACGDVLEYRGIQRVEAALFAVESINKDRSLLPGITLGINIKDDCESESIAVHQVMDILQKSDQSNNPKETNLRANVNSHTNETSLLLSILGPGTSSLTATVQNYMKVFKIFQIGYAATSEEIMNALNYYHFISVVPSDYYQSYVVAKILKKNKWNYVSVAYSTGTYGRMGLHYLENFTLQLGICIAAREELFITNSIDDNNQAFKNLARDKVKVIVCFCEKFAVRNLLQSIRSLGLAGQYLIIGTDGWSSNYEVVKGYEEEAVGSLSVGIRTYPLPEFDQYYTKKNFLNNQINPWFEEFWQLKFNCTIKKGNESTDKAPCSENQSLKQDYVPDSSIYHIIEAIYALARTLHTYACDNKTDCSKLNSVNSSILLTAFLQSGLKFNGQHINITDWGTPRVTNYSIYNFQKTPNGTYHYTKVGQYDDYEYQSHHSRLELPKSGDFQFNKALLQFPRGNKTVISSCSELCPPGFVQKKDIGQERQCCWACISCELGKYQVNDTHCDDCSQDTWPNENRTQCEPVPLQHIDYGRPKAQILMSMSTLGLISTLCTAFVFVKNSDTPVVKSSTRELCYMILIGMIMAHCVTFAVVAQPTEITCAISRITLPVSFSIIYGALLVKTNRIARLLSLSKRKFPNLYPRFMTLKAQIIMVSILIAAETLISVTTLFTEPPTPTQIYKIIENERKGWLICPNNKETILTSFSLVVFLVIMCTFYAFKTRHLPQCFNEAKYIGFSMYATCITWVAFGWIHYENVNNYQVITSCVWATTNALIILLFLFLPKLYIILYTPEQNARIYFATTKGIRFMIGKEDSLRISSARSTLEQNSILKLPADKSTCNCNGQLSIGN
ncbi:metabotropic glutamate receptor 5-like isoform X2 [Planococcus citri]|uniref:metabotropic glutamate receptor 5-like isoform X2 n=1 Tax=Planococcus citri TaxID=170843 RepID=UPI0031FA4516